MKKALIFLLAVLLLSSMLAAAWAEDPLHRLFGEGEPDVLGEPFPDFTVKDTKKNEFTLSEALKDHEAVLINFFASWCGPCIRELPLLNELYNQYGDRVAFIGLDFEPDDTLLDIAEIRIENKVPFPMGKTAGTGLNEYLGVFRLPQTVVIDRFGNLCFMHSNAFESAEELARVLDTFVGDDYTESRILNYIPMKASTCAFPVSGTFAYYVENESARKVAIRYNDDDGNVEFGYIIPDDIAHLRFEISPEMQPADMCYFTQTDTDKSLHALSSLLDPDRNVYVYEQPMNQLSYGHRVVMGSFESRTTDDNFVFILLFPDEKAVDEYTDWFREDAPGISWEYAEDEEPKAAQSEAYLLHLIDQYGDPVPDVKINFCTDVACALQIADENGLISFSAPLENYHVQLLKVPEGYSFDPGFELCTGDAFGEWDILIRKADTQAGFINKSGARFHGSYERLNSDIFSMELRKLTAEGTLVSFGPEEELGGFRAVFHIPAEAEATLHLYDDPTGIKHLNAYFNESIYNISGQRLSKPAKGINVMNGKKILR